MSSFKDAFKAARKAQGAGGTFEWKGKRYTTDYKEEVAKKSKKASTAPKSSPRPQGRNSGKPTVDSTAPTQGPAPKSEKLKVSRPYQKKLSDYFKSATKRKTSRPQ